MPSDIRVAGGLAANFFLLWLVSALFWLTRFGRPQVKAALLAPIMPPYFGMLALEHGNLDMAGVSLLVTLGAAALSLAAFFRPDHILLSILAHLAIVFYWF